MSKNLYQDRRTYLMIIIDETLQEEDSDTTRKEGQGKRTDGTKSGGEIGHDGERRKTYSSAVIDGFKRNSTIYVGVIHQGSALSPLLFITVIDVISQEVGRGPPHAMLFADDLVLCENTRKEAEEQLELWRRAIENKGLRVSRSKTEYLPPSSCHDSKVKLGEEEIKNVTTFKYLGSMFDAEGGSTTDCKNRVRLAWNKWREITGVICDKKSTCQAQT